MSKEATKSNLKRNALIGAGILVVLLLVGASGYFYLEYQRAQKLLQNPTEAAQAEVTSLITKVGNIIELPAKETPTVATVSDKNKLKEQAFFTKSQNGDKVLIYTQAKQAFLYRPSNNKIIAVAPVNVGASDEQQTLGATTAPKQTAAKVALYNGTPVVGLTGTAEKQLKETLPGVEVVTKENAAKNDYGKTIIVDLSGKQQEAAAQLAKLLQGEVTTLPEGETKPKDADLLIILGKTQE